VGPGPYQPIMTPYFPYFHGGRPRVCYKCGIPGHIAKDCPTNYGLPPTSMLGPGGPGGPMMGPGGPFPGDMGLYYPPHLGFPPGGPYPPYRDQEWERERERPRDGRYRSRSSSPRRSRYFILPELTFSEKLNFNFIYLDKTTIFSEKFESCLSFSNW
jgi:hypothetical protein